MRVVNKGIDEKEYSQLKGVIQKKKTFKKKIKHSNLLKAHGNGNKKIVT